jgi:hypothetical protein
LKEVNRLASSGRLRAASRNDRVCLPRSATVIVPLRSWSRKLKPPAAPKPGMVRGAKGKITAPGVGRERLRVL